MVTRASPWSLCYQAHYGASAKPENHTVVLQHVPTRRPNAEFNDVISWFGGDAK